MASNKIEKAISARAFGIYMREEYQRLKAPELEKRTKKLIKDGTPITHKNIRKTKQLDKTNRNYLLKLAGQGWKKLRPEKRRKYEIEALNQIDEEEENLKAIRSDQKQSPFPMQNIYSSNNN